MPTEEAKANLSASMQDRFSALAAVEDQQTLQRIVGRRRPREGRALTAADRAAMTRMAQYRTRAPKGVFVYYSAEEMENDRLRWTVDAMIEKQR